MKMRKPILFKLLLLIAVVIFYIMSGIFLYCSDAQAQDSTEAYITPPPSFELVEPMLADRTNIPAGAFVTPMNVGAVARSQGVLYSLEANAWLLSEFAAVQNRLILEMNARVAQTRAWADHEFRLQRIALSTDLEITRVHLEAREREVELLTETNTRLLRQVGWSRKEKFRTVLIAIGTGVASGFVMYYVGRAAAN